MLVSQKTAVLNTKLLFAFYLFITRFMRRLPGASTLFSFMIIIISMFSKSFSKYKIYFPSKTKTKTLQKLKIYILVVIEY